MTIQSNLQDYQSFANKVKELTDIELPNVMPKLGTELVINKPNKDLFPKHKRTLMFTYLGGEDGCIYDAEQGELNQTYVFESFLDGYNGFLRANRQNYLSKDEKRAKATKLRIFEECKKADSFYKKSSVLKTDNPLLNQLGIDWHGVIELEHYVGYVPNQERCKYENSLVKVGDLKQFNNAIIQIFWGLSNNTYLESDLSVCAYRLFKADGTIEQSNDNLVKNGFHIHQVGLNPLTIFTTNLKDSIRLKGKMPNATIIECFNLNNLNIDLSKCAFRHGKQYVFALSQQQADSLPNDKNQKIIIIGGEDE